MALLDTTDTRLFGLDLGALPALWRDAWGRCLQWLPLRRCMPAARMQLWSQGQVRSARVRGAHLVWEPLQGGSATSAPYSAVLLAYEQVLWRSLRLPGTLSGKALHAAVALDVQTMSPFPPEHTLWAWAVRDEEGAHGDALRQVDIAITARHLVQQALERSGAAPQSAPEIWAEAPEQGGAPLLLPGFGERRRLAREARQRLLVLLGCVGTAALLAALAVTPSLQLRLRANDAQRQFLQLSHNSREAAALRQSLLEEAEALGELLQRPSRQIDHVQVLATLTDLLPDHTAVQMVQFQGQTLSVQGLSDNASEIVNLLARHPGFRDVRLPSAVTRAPRSEKDNFTLQARLDPAVFARHPPAAPEHPATTVPTAP